MFSSPYISGQPQASWPAPWPPAQATSVPAAPRPAPLSPQAAAAPQPRPIVRLQAPEELIPNDPPKPLVLPAPEQLGVALARPTTPALLDLPVDWNVTRDRLNRLGALHFAVTKLPAGAYRIAFELPTTQPGRTHHIEAEAATEGAAVCQALDLADLWTGQHSKAS